MYSKPKKENQLMEHWVLQFLNMPEFRPFILKEWYVLLAIPAIGQMKKQDL